MELTYTTSLHKIRQLDKRVRIVQGGSSSGKTYSILVYLIDYAITHSNVHISIVSESMPHLRRGANKDFIDIMKDTNRWNEKRYNYTNMTYRFSNNAIIEFFSADQPDKLKGGRRDILYLNECNSISYEAYQQLIIRTKRFSYIDYNPDHAFWAITDVQYEPNSQLIKLDYRDNEALDQTIIDEFLDKIKKAETSDYWKNWVNVYVYGELGTLQGAIFNNWKIIETIPSEAELIGYGLDFGFTNDATALISVFKHDSKLILDEIIFETNLTNNQIVNIMKMEGIDKKAYIYSESSEPKSIKEIQLLGYRNIMPVVKGADSLLYGIQLMQQFDFLITKNSINLIEEFQNYKWKLNKDSQSTNIPEDKYNHGIDAVRYLIMSKYGGSAPKTKKYSLTL